MKNIDEFKDFMVTTVNLNPTRIGRLEEGIRIMKSFIRDSVYQATDFAPQGSWAHKTIIKPPTERKDFDVDLLVFIDSKEHWKAGDYIKNLYNIFSEHETYKEKVTKKTHCVQLNYEDDFHVDMVPYVKKGNEHEICNRQDDCFESTRSEEYTRWFNQKNQTSNDHLVNVVKLLKYLRDIKGNFSVASIVLSTLSAQKEERSYNNLPTALFEITQKIRNYLYENPNVPYITNPVLSNENLASGWDNTQYQNFKEKFIHYADSIKEAYHESDNNKSIEKWKCILGEKFKKSDTSLETNRQHYTSATSFGHGKEEYDIISKCQRNITGSEIDNLTYTDKIECSIDPRITIEIKAEVYEWKEWKPYNSDRFLKSNCTLKFKCVSSFTGTLATSAENTTKWRVTNSGDAAFFANQLRGKIIDCSEKEFNLRYEPTLYNGLHFIEAFIIKNDYIIGRSEPFKVLIFDTTD